MYGKNPPNLAITAVMTAPTVAGSQPWLSSDTHTAPILAHTNSGRYRTARTYTRAGIERRGPGFVMVPEEKRNMRMKYLNGFV